MKLDLYSQVLAAGLPEPAVEFRFAPARRYRADLAWPERRLLVEIEGGIWRRGGGAHSRPTNIVRDIEKANLACLSGFRQLRVTTDMVRSGEALRLIEAALRGAP